MDKKYVVLTSQYGSGARLAGRMLADNLSINFYGEKELMKIASEKYGIDEKILIDFETEILKGNSDNIADIDKVIVGDNEMCISKIYEEIINDVVNQGPCILMERGTDVILSGRTDVLNVYAYSSNIDMKVDRCVRVDGIPEEKALKHIEFQDAQRKKYYSLVYNSERADMKQYDLCINTDALGLEKCAELMKAAL